MEFKIDTKETFSVITPLSNQIDAILSGELHLKCDYLRQIGSNNYIVDLSLGKTIDNGGISGFIELHEYIYSLNNSLAFTGMSPDILKVLKKGEHDLLLNIAPKMEEAIDIISMEILERDLLGEE